MKYVALFRGINVGGKNIVKMSELKKLFESLGFLVFQTYIQSGNVVFASNEDTKTTMNKIRAGFNTAFGFDCAVTFRTAVEMQAILSGLPFSAEEIEEAKAANNQVEHLYVYLADEDIPVQSVEKLVSDYTGPDMPRASGREVYLLCHQSVRDSKPAAALAKLGMPMTARNWKTMTKLCELIKA